MGMVHIRVPQQESSARECPKHSANMRIDIRRALWKAGCTPTTPRCNINIWQIWLKPKYLETSYFFKLRLILKKYATTIDSLVAVSSMPYLSWLQHFCFMFYDCYKKSLLARVAVKKKFSIHHKTTCSIVMSEFLLLVMS